MVENSMADGVGLPRANENSSIACQTSLTANIGSNGSFAEVSNLKNDVPATKADECNGDTRSLDKQIWDRIEEYIERTPTDGIGAEGTFSEIVSEGQRAYVKGLRSARLRAMTIVRRASPPAPTPTVDEEMFNEVVAALKALLAVVQDAPGMRGREYIGVGIQVHNALAKANRAQSALAPMPVVDEVKD